MADTSPAPRTRALIHGLDGLRRGQPGEIRVTLAHPMESGQRQDGLGNLLPRNIVTRFKCQLDGQPVFSADLYPAIAANPYLAFWLRIDGPGTLRFDWTGDRGFSHRETRSVNPA